MKRLLVMILLAGSVAANAQMTPADPDVPAETEPCVPIGEGVPDDLQPADDGVLPKPCEDPGAAIAADDALEESEELPTEASVEEEFKPGDEISEDYPVPLPADI